MIAAHLPAGYLQYRAMGRRGKAALSAALAGSMAPDLDMIWFHLVDHGTIHHHRYWPHIPAVWLGLLALAALIWRVHPAPWVRWFMVFASACLVHMVLDTLAGGIMWLWPLDQHLYVWVTVPATRSHWVLSFLLHWTFLVELAIFAVAGWLLLFKRTN